jgi:hypothetical protein
MIMTQQDEKEQKREQDEKVFIKVFFFFLSNAKRMETKLEIWKS